jgi:hypothetical protein
LRFIADPFLIVVKRALFARRFERHDLRGADAALRRRGHGVPHIFSNPTSVSVNMSRAGLTSSQPILRIHKASFVLTCATVIFEKLSFHVANLERVSGNAVLRFENVQDGYSRLLGRW